MKVDDNIKTTLNVNDTFNNRDWASFENLHTDDVIAYSPGTDEPTRDVKSHREQIEGMVEAFPDFKIESRRTFGQDDWVCAEFTVAGTHKGILKGANGKDIPATNRPVKLNIMSMMRFKDGKIVEEHNYWDRMALMEQLGVAP